VTAHSGADPGDRLVFYGGTYPKLWNAPAVFTKALTLTATNGNAIIGKE
jgi:hypothetical protein